MDAHDLSRSLLGWVWQHRRRWIPGLSIALCRILTIAPLPLVFRHIIDRLLPGGDVRGILQLGAFTLLLLVAHYFFSIAGAARLGRAVANVVLELRGRTFHKIQYLNFGYIDHQKTGRLLSKYAFDSQRIEMVMMPILNSFIPDLLYSLLTFAILVFLNWQLAFVILLILPLFAYMRAHFFERFQRRNQDSRLAQERMAGTASEFFTALRLVRFYGEERQAEDRLLSDNHEVARTRVELVRTTSSFAAFSWGAIQALSLLVVAGGAILAIHGHVSTGVVIAFVAGLPALVNPVQMFANISEQYFLGNEAFRSLRELLAAPYVENWEGNRRLPELRGEVAFRNVSFHYPEGDRNALSAFSLNIRAGEKIALVGASGAGKTTVANLLLGLYRPDEGEITIDDIPQAELDMRWLRRQTAIVLQESMLLSGSVKDNLRFARVDASDAELVEAARSAHADAFIRQLPEGYDTLLGERGANLSGGQRQRLAIARALLRNPRILILDEPTSALDYESERHIQAALQTLTRGRTVLTIAHRLSTIRDADRIIVLVDGRIADSGSYADLSSRHGPFKDLLAAATD